MNRSIVSILIFLLSAVPAVAQRTAEGKVFIDANANGVYDRGERLLGSVPVSNGSEIVVTDAKGRYKIDVVEGGSLFPVLPAGYTMSGGRVVNSHFIPYDSIRRRGNDFALAECAVRTRFRLNAIGDMQVNGFQDLEYASRTLFPELLRADSADINLFLGDQVNNKMHLHAPVYGMISRLPSRTYTVLGNHDRDVDSVHSRQVRSYCNSFGSDVYAFNEGEVHFVVLNNNKPDGARGYTENLTDRSLCFLRNDLALVPAGRLVVIAMHAPLKYCKNRQALLDLVRGRNVLVITGHMHRVMRFFHTSGDRIIPEVVVGATCGTWWMGERDWDGVPMALQQGGTPRNYFVFDFNGTDYSYRCKGVGLDAGRQMSIYVTGVDTIDAHLRGLAQLGRGHALVNVWGGSDSTTVRCRVDGGRWQVCRKLKMTDPNVERVVELIRSKGYPTPFSRRDPLRRSSSPQLWTYALASGELEGPHLIEVEASDRYGFRAGWSRVYCFPVE